MDKLPSCHLNVDENVNSKEPLQNNVWVGMQRRVWVGGTLHGLLLINSPPTKCQYTKLIFFDTAL